MENNMPSFVIGCDGGGSGCRVVVADANGRVLAQAAGGPANVTSDFDGAIASLSAALADAARQLGLSLGDFSDAVAHFGLAGVQSAQGAARVAAALPLRNPRITEDRVVAVAGALGDADGVLLAIGTGTIIAASRAGVLSHVGGWGLQLSDQASGAWLGRAVLERVLLCHDGLEAFGDLTSQIFAEFIRDPGALVRFAATARPADYAGYAPVVVQAAKAGDADGVALMQRGAAYLARALDVIHFVPSDLLCLTGGVAPHYAPYLPAAAQQAIAPAKGSGVDGALRLALAAVKERG